MITMTFQATDLYDLRSQLKAASHAIMTPDAVEAKQAEKEEQIAEEFYTKVPEASPSPVPSLNNEQIPATQPNEISSEVVGSNLERDSRGVAWDARVHASSKQTNKDGTWRTRRNVDEALLKQVEGGPTPSAAQSPVPNVVVPFTPPPVVATIPVDMPNFAPVQPVAQPESMPTKQPQYDNFPQPTGVKPAHNLETFKANLLVLLSQLTTSGKITQDYVEQLKAYFKVSEIWHVTNDPAKLEELYRTFTGAGLITAV